MGQGGEVCERGRLGKQGDVKGWRANVCHYLAADGDVGGEMSDCTSDYISGFAARMAHGGVKCEGWPGPQTEPMHLRSAQIGGASWHQSMPPPGPNTPPQPHGMIPLGVPPEAVHADLA